MDDNNMNNLKMSLRDLQGEVIPLRREIPKIIEDLAKKDMELIQKHCERISTKEKDIKISTPTINTSFYLGQLSEVQELPNYSERLVKLNSKMNTFQKFKELYKK